MLRKERVCGLGKGVQGLPGSRKKGHLGSGSVKGCRWVSVLWSGEFRRVLALGKGAQGRPSARERQLSGSRTGGPARPSPLPAQSSSGPAIGAALSFPPMEDRVYRDVTGRWADGWSGSGRERRAASAARV